VSFTVVVFPFAFFLTLYLGFCEGLCLVADLMADLVCVLALDRFFCVSVLVMATGLVLCADLVTIYLMGDFSLLFRLFN
jgi:hypothetical protein